MATPKPKDDISGRETTGHEWDGITELNTPLPSWWLYVLYATIVWAIGYWLVYPAWPTIEGYTRGLFGWSSRAQYAERADQAVQARRVWVDQLARQSTEQIATDPNLLTYAIAGGAAIFDGNCAACHGAGGQGSRGFPVLADDDWIWGGDLASIEQTVRYGIRSAHPETRQSEMPRFGADGLLTAEQIADVTAHVLSLAGDETSGDKAAAARGAVVFAEQCAACHGEAGTGLPELGAPNLADRIQLFGEGPAALAAQIAKPRHGVMPAWSGRLDDVALKMTVLYVHTLGGGE